MIVDYIVIENVDGRQHIETWMGETEDSMRLTSVSTLPRAAVPGTVRGNFNFPHMKDEHGHEATFRPPDIKEATVIAGCAGVTYDRASHVSQTLESTALEIVSEREAARLLGTRKGKVRRAVQELIASREN